MTAPMNPDPSASPPPAPPAYGPPPQAGPPGSNVPPPPPGPPGYGPAPMGAPMPPAPAKPKKKALVRLGILVGVIVVLIIGGVVYRHVSGSPDVAKAGDCMTGQTGDTLKVVACTSSTAQWTVVGKVDNQAQSTGISGMDSACDPFPTAEASFWKGSDGGKGYVLCLAPKS